MASCCYQHQICNPYGSSCCIVELEPLEDPKPPVKQQTMLKRQGIFPWTRENPARANTPEENYRQPPMRQYWHPAAFVSPEIPSINISEDMTGPYLASRSNLETFGGKTVRHGLLMTETKFYEKNRGPILRIQGPIKDTVLTHKEFLKIEEDGTPIEAKMADYSEFHPQVEDVFVCTELAFEPFATTKMCKETRFLTLRNEGTVAIRYLWLRSPPSRAMRKILARPGSVINVKKLQPPSDEPVFWKDDSFEFHFRELPGVILPGQYVQVPVIFRPRSNGYFYDNMFLLTHPRLSDENDSTFKIRLSGICMDPDCPKPHSNEPKLRNSANITPEKVLRRIRSKMIFHEASDTLDTILDHLLYDKPVPKSTLPLGKVTAEQVFRAHNPDFQYKHNFAEKSLEIIRAVAQDLVPKDRIIQSKNICPLSIAKLHAEICRTPPPSEYFWNNFKNPELEDRLQQLSHQTKVVSTIDEIIAGTANIENDCIQENMKKVLARGVQDKLLRRKRKEQMRQLRRAERLGRKQNKYSKFPRENFYEKGGGDTIEFRGEDFMEIKKELIPEVVITEEEINSELREWATTKEKHSKQLLFETIFGCNVERMMSVVDSFRAIYNYHGLEEANCETMCN